MALTTLPLNTIVDVGISVAPQGITQFGFGTLCAVTAETGVIGVAERIRSYGSITEVSADWSSDTELYKVAQAYFSQNPSPTEFRAAVRFPEAQPGELRCGAVVDPKPFFSVTDGSFVVSIDNASEEITGINMSGATSFTEVATLIEDAIQTVGTGGFTAATVEYKDNRFYVFSGSVGEASTISFMTTAASGTDISSMMQARQGEATKQNGVDAETITASLSAIEQAQDDFYGVIFTKEVRDSAVVNGEDAVLAAANWTQARSKVFFNTTNDLDALDSVNTNDVLSKLNDSSLDRTFSVFSSYPDQYPAASAAGRAFSVNFNGTNTTITLKFKQLPGITVERLNSTQKAALDSKSGNAFISVAGTSLLAEGWMAGGRFFDEVHG